MGPLFKETAKLVAVTILTPLAGVKSASSTMIPPRLLLQVLYPRTEFKIWEQTVKPPWGRNPLCDKLICCLRDGPQVQGDTKPRRPTGLTDTWYCTSDVHTSSSPTTHGMASVWPFRSFKACRGDKRADGYFLPPLCPT